MLACRRRLIEQIHASGVRLCAAVTGGGSQALADLLAVPGASASVLEGSIPYAPQALCNYLQAKPEQFCQPRTARAMAMAAFQHARQLRADSPAERLVGLGCTASLASDRPKRGAHRAHVAAQTAGWTACWSLELEKEARSRIAEERLTSDLLLHAAAAAADVEPAWPLALRPQEGVDFSRTLAPPGWQALLLGNLQAVLAEETPDLQTDGLRPGGKTGRVIFPGAFNPLHSGHLQMAQLAERRTGQPVEFEISVFNVDKPPLDYMEMQQRGAQFVGQGRLWFTRAARFYEKAATFPGATFLVGMDTICRLADPRYYDDERGCLAAIERISAAGCRFLVFGRNVQGEFQGLADAPIPQGLRRLCDEVPEEEFRMDVSSTELRQARQAP